MKIFEITKINEVELSSLSQEIQNAVGNLSSIIQQLAGSNAQQAQSADDSGSDASANAGGENNPSRMIQDLADQVRSGEAELSKNIDAELGKTGVNAQDMHIAVMSKIQDAANDAGQQIAQASGRTGSQAMSIIDRADLFITGAAFGYINKKYLNGDDQNYQGNTLELIRNVMQSQQPRGGAQPAGRQSSARTQGQQGTVPSGGGTNALDQAADDRLRNRDF